MNRRTILKYLTLAPLVALIPASVRAKAEKLWCMVNGRKYEAIDAAEFFHGEGVHFDITEDDLISDMPHMSAESRKRFLEAQAKLKAMLPGTVFVDTRKPLS